MQLTHTLDICYMFHTLSVCVWVCGKLLHAQPAICRPNLYYIVEIGPESSVQTSYFVPCRGYRLFFEILSEIGLAVRLLFTVPGSPCVQSPVRASPRCRNLARMLGYRSNRCQNYEEGAAVTISQHASPFANQNALKYLVKLST
jgi:hypothetical protein